MSDVELFGGAGAASVGLASVGIHAIGFELDADACATHHAAGHRTIRADLATYPWPASLRGRVRYMHGSPPCQPFSAAGDGAGEDDDRDGMPWMLRAVDELRPAVVTIENVPGLTFAPHRRYFGAFLHELRGYGYDVDWRILCAADFGVPQCRYRLIIIARRDGTPIRWPEVTHIDGGGMFHAPWVSMADALGWPQHFEVERIRAGRDEHATVRSSADPAPTVLARKDPNGWTRHRPATTINGDPRVSAPGRHDPDVSGSQQADAIRVTLDELATLQGFPAGYPFHGNKTSIARQIGNALPPALIAAVARVNVPDAIRTAEGSQP